MIINDQEVAPTDGRKYTDESEKSYDFENSTWDAVDGILFWVFTIPWLFVTETSVCLITFLMTYYIVFDQHIPHESFYIIHVCNVIVVTDIILKILSIYLERVYTRTVYPILPKTLVIADIFFLYSIIIEQLPYNYVLTLKVVYMVAILFKHYRLIIYFKTMRLTMTYSNIYLLTAKYAFCYFLLIHLMACIQYSQYLKEPKESYNYFRKPGALKMIAEMKLQYKNKKRKSNKFYPIELYLITLYNVMGSVTFLGYGSPSPRNTKEQVISTFVMVTAFLITTIYTCGFVFSKVCAYKLQIKQSLRLHDVNKFLKEKKVPHEIRKEVFKYYITLWEERFVPDFNIFNHIFPPSLLGDLQLDKYWNALKQMYLFYDESYSAKRLIASIMRTELYTTGDVIVNQGELSNKILYIALGNVDILSEEDGQSPLISLAMGSVLGEICLFHIITCKFSMVAKSYTIMHVLDHEKFWRLRALKFVNPALRHWSKIMTRLEAAKKFAITGKRIKHLALVKNLLLTGSEIHIYDTRLSIDYNKSNLPYSDYILNKQQHINTSENHVFYRSSFPWKFQQNSNFLLIWESIVVVTCIVDLIRWPHSLYFKQIIRVEDTHFWSNQIELIYVLDIMIQLSTVKLTKYGVQYKMTDILRERFSFSFYVDVIAAIPFHLLYFVNVSVQDSLPLTLVYSLRLVKLFKVPIFILKLQGRYLFHKLLKFRHAMHLFRVAFLLQFSTCLYYRFICSGRNCYANNWISKDLKKQIELFGEEAKDSYNDNLYTFVFAYFISVYAKIAIGGATTLTDIYLIILFSVIAHSIYTYMVAEFVSVNYLIQIDEIDQTYLNNLNLYINKRKLPEAMKKRIVNYAVTRSQHGMTSEGTNIFSDLPQRFHRKIQIACYVQFLKEEPLFMNLPDNIIENIACAVKPLVLPPCELVIHKGSILEEMFIIEAGYCEIWHPNTSVAKKVFPPGSSIGVIEMMLKIPSICSIRTVTYVSLLQIPRNHIMWVLLSEPEFSDKFNEAVEEHIDMHYKTHSRTFDSTSKSEEVYMDIGYNDERSWINFKSDDAAYHDYQKRFPESNISLLRYFLMARTIHPGGKFLLIWEIIRTLAVMGNIAIDYLSLLFINSHSIFSAILAPFELILFIDIYLQMHVCYYNNHGILITHPTATLSHYLHSHFAVDFLGSLPINKLLILMSTVEQNEASYYTMIVLFLHKILLIPRARGLFLNSGDVTKFKCTRIIAFFLTMLLALITFCSLILVHITGNVKFVDGIYTIVPSNRSWMLDPVIKIKNITEPADFFYITWIWTVHSFIQTGLSPRLSVKDVSERIFTIFACIIGFLFFFNLVTFLAMQYCSSVGTKTFFEKKACLNSFMRLEKIPKSISRKADEYYKYLFNMNCCFNLEVVKFNSKPLRGDICYILYNDTLLNTQVFKNSSSALRRLILLNICEKHFLPDMVIQQINDIIGKLYIIHRGYIEVVAADGTVITKLHTGGIFGNFQDMELIRSMITVRAVSPVELIEIDSKILYETVDSDFVNNLQGLSFDNGMSFIPGLKVVDSNSEKDLIYSSKLASEESWPYFIFQHFLGFFTYLLVTYVIAFRTYLTWHLYVIWFLDITTIVNVIFKISCKERTNSDALQQRFKITYTHTEKIMDVISVIPFELLAILINKEYLKYFLANRLLRLNAIYYQFRRRKEINIQYSTLFTMSFLFTTCIHTTSCAFIIATTCHTKDKCSNWSFSDIFGFICDNLHWCAVFHATALTIAPGNIINKEPYMWDNFMNIISAIIGRFITINILTYGVGIISLAMHSLEHINQLSTLVKHALQTSLISQVLCERTMCYVQTLFAYNKLINIPDLIEEAPVHLRASILEAVYERHIYFNVLFEECHIDFLRQVLWNIRVVHFFPGDIICQAGDINGTMYFIHKGKVAVINLSDYIVDYLNEDDSFGLIQGLDTTITHMHTYKACTVTTILCLEFEKWKYLLTFFPACKHFLYSTINHLIEEQKRTIKLELSRASNLSIFTLV